MKKSVLTFIAIIFLFDVYAQSYKKLHFNSIVCDTHNDIISTCIEKGIALIEYSPVQHIVI